MEHDILIIGAGPSGLCMARALAGSGLRVIVLEQGDAAALADPADDGREIALTHASRAALERLGMWQAFAPEEIGELRRALVIDGDDREGLQFDPPAGEAGPLGWMLPNHAIRRAAFACASGTEGVAIVGGARVAALAPSAQAIEVRLEDGRRFRARLAIAADNRFSGCRRAMGLRADHHDFGKVMVVVKVVHEQPHQATAWEWFRYGQTLALLPLHDPQTSSAVLTLVPAEAAAFMAKSAEEQGLDLARRFEHRLGAIRIAAAPHAYPLVGVYARRFVGPRFALVGDAAVGMHPVTAHGFNFGLLSIDNLAGTVRAAHATGGDVAAAAGLARYEQTQRRATLPLYLATQLVIQLYTRDSPPARALRNLALHVGERFTPFKRMIAASLTGGA